MHIDAFACADHLKRIPYHFRHTFRLFGGQGAFPSRPTSERAIRTCRNAVLAHRQTRKLRADQGRALGGRRRQGRRTRTRRLSGEEGVTVRGTAPPVAAGLWGHGRAARPWEGGAAQKPGAETPSAKIHSKLVPLTPPGIWAHRFFELRPAAATRRASEGQKTSSCDARGSNLGVNPPLQKRRNPLKTCHRTPPKVHPMQFCAQDCFLPNSLC